MCSDSAESTKLEPRHARLASRTHELGCVRTGVAHSGADQPVDRAIFDAMFTWRYQRDEVPFEAEGIEAFATVAEPESARRWSNVFVQRNSWSTFGPCPLMLIRSWFRLFAQGNIGR